MMASEKDLLDKADALLRRHSLGQGSETGTYPVLTDLVVPPELQQPQERAPDEAPQAAPEPPPAPQEAPQPQPQDAQLHDELVARVLAQLRTTLGIEMERQVAETLAPQLRAAVAEALGGLQERLAGLVADAVTRALEERGPVK